jgi:hypothetical protein
LSIPHIKTVRYLQAGHQALISREKKVIRALIWSVSDEEDGIPAPEKDALGSYSSHGSRLVLVQYFTGYPAHQSA